MPDSKTCTKCGETKPLTEFHKDSKARDGRRSACKTCQSRTERESENRRRYREDNREAKREYDRRYYEDNRESKIEYIRDWREVNPEYGRRYHEENREAESERNRRWRENNTEYNRKRHRQWVIDNPEYYRECGRQSRAKTRTAVFAHYSPSTPPCCACCGSTESLSIDHINGDGREHRILLKETGVWRPSGWQFYLWLIKENFPAGYQILCLPCNSSKADGTHCRLTH